MAHFVGIDLPMFPNVCAFLNIYFIPFALNLSDRHDIFIVKLAKKNSVLES